MSVHEVMNAFNDKVLGRTQPAKVVCNPDKYKQDMINAGAEIGPGVYRFNGSELVFDEEEPDFHFEGTMVS